jgi:HSP20 family protein
MSRTAWNPFREMQDLLDRCGFAGARDSNNEAELHGVDWIPATDVDETPDNYRVRAEIPGVGKDQVDVQFDNGVLILAGDKPAEYKSQHGWKRHRSECLYGSFARRITLPGGVRPGAIDAHYADGVLTVTIPKTTPGYAAAVTIKVR